MATTSSNPPDPVTVFIGYAKKDQRMLDSFVQHLEGLKSDGLITVLHMKEIEPGKEWDKEIREWLEDARIILFLVSSDLMASVYCNEVEVKRALERHYKGECKVIPIILRPSVWESTALGKFQALPRNGKPVATWRPQDEGFVNVINSLKKMILPPPPLKKSNKSKYTQEAHKQNNIKQIPKGKKNNSKQIPWNIPGDNPFFTGRENIVEQLHIKLGKSRWAALTQSITDGGSRGIGKSQIAMKYANQYRQDYQSGLWIQADSLPALNASLAEIVRLFPQEFTSDRVDYYQKMKTWLTKNTGWLLILDDIYSFEVIKKLVPDGIQKNGHIIITTREQATSRIPHVEVSKMGEDEGALFLLKRVYNIHDPAELPESLKTGGIYEKAREIVTVLDGHPLTIDQAGDYVYQTGESLLGFLKIYLDRPGLILEIRGNNQMVPPNGHSKSVTQTLKLPFNEVAKINPAAVELLKFCVDFPADKIQEHIITNGACFLGQTLEPVARDKIRLNEAFALLLSQSLISREPGVTTTQITVPRVQRTVMVILHEMSYDERYLWARRALQALMHSDNPKGYSKTEELYRKELSTLATSNDPPRKILYLNMLAELYRRLARYDDAREKLAEATEICENTLKRQLSDDHKEMWCCGLVICMNNLAKLYYAQGDFRSAQHECEKAIRICDVFFRLEHFLAADCRHNLATIYTAYGEYAMAETQFNLTRNIREKKLSSVDLDIAQRYNDVGDLYRVMGKYVLAEHEYKTALLLYKRVFGENCPHPDVAQSLSNLAELDRIRGNYEAAKEKHVMALEMRKTILVADHPAIAQSLIYIAELDRIRKNYVGAEQGIHKAMEIWEIRKQRSGADPAKDHPDMASCWNTLGDIELDRGKYESGQKYFEKAYDLREKIYGVKHILVASSLNKRGNASLHLEKYDLAAKYFKEALRIRKDMLGTVHPLVANSYWTLAQLYYYQSTSSETRRAFPSKSFQARRSFKRAIGIYRQTDLSRSPDIAYCYSFLARLYEESSKLKKADLHYKEAECIYEQTLGSAHERTRTVQGNWMKLLRKMGREEEAAEIEEEMKKNVEECW